MALLVATAGSTPPAPRRGRTPAQAAAHRSPGPVAHEGAGSRAVSTTTTTTTTTTTPTAASSGSADVGSSLLSTRTPGTVAAPQAAPAAVSTTTVAPATTTTQPSASVPADRTQTQGYLDPPTQTSNEYGFTGTGAMEISVLWSGDTYLTMEVSCPNGSQNVGGTSAMEASLPDASGSCLATVREPASQTTSLTYTISIGPAGG
jgi:hypothetical protein